MPAMPYPTNTRRRFFVYQSAAVSLHAGDAVQYCCSHRKTIDRAPEPFPGTRTREIFPRSEGRRQNHRCVDSKVEA